MPHHNLEPISLSEGMERYEKSRKRGLCVKTNFGTRKRKREIVERMEELYFVIYIRPGMIRSIYSLYIPGTNKQRCPKHNLGSLGGGMRMRGEGLNNTKAPANPVEGTYGQVRRRGKWPYPQGLTSYRGS